ncbi:Ca2+-dependent phosphoinositide-specific phospholipase C [Nocardia sp. NPDC051981]|uniref:Ca2+-dependent phosphoinositide-specific phospholipase C n=1 Tax=Nocardia sp. NPDC051981 TaxID=3155417 RepID=UPI003429E8D7
MPGQRPPPGRLSATRGSLQGRVTFPTPKPGSSDAAVILSDDSGNGDRIHELVQAGYMVRARSDENPAEARRGDTTRAATALASGTQWVSTDFPRPDPRINPTFAVQVPGRCGTRWRRWRWRPAAIK